MAPVKSNKILAISALALLAGTKIAAAANIDTNMAHMQAMDKITGKVSEIDVPVGGEADFGSFSIVVRKCVTRSPEETPENTAFVDVVDNYNSEEPVNIFKGWMMSSSPALNAIEHPIYDVWLLKCYNGDMTGKKLLSEDELILRDEVPMLKTAEENKPTAPAAAAENTTEDAPATEETAAPAAAEEAPAEVVSVVVSAPDSVEDGSPRALLQVQTQPQEETPAEEKPAVTEPAEENAAAPEPALPEEDGFIQFDEESDEDGFELNAEALVSE